MPTHYSGTPQQVLALDTFIKFTRASATLESFLYQNKVLEGLTPGQSVVRAGHQKLFDGGKVLPVPDARAAAASASTKGR